MLQDADAILADCRDLVEQHGLDVEATRQAIKAMLYEQPVNAARRYLACNFEELFAGLIQRKTKRQASDERGSVLGSKGKAKEALIGVPSATHWADTWDDPHWQAFVKAYQDAWPAEKRFPTPSFCAVNYYDETTAALLPLDKVNGDLSDGHRKFRQALASLVLDAPNGQIKLDENRQAIGTVFVTEVVKDQHGDLVNRWSRSYPTCSSGLGSPRRPSTESACPGAKSQYARRCTTSDWGGGKFLRLARWLRLVRLTANVSREQF
jgi:hypothetical protein